MRFSTPVFLSPLMFLLPLLSPAARGDNEMLDPDNLKSLGCVAPSIDYQVLKVGKPGAIFYPGEEAELTVQVTRKDVPLNSVTLAVQEVSTRQGKLYDQKPMGWSMTPPPVVDVVRQCGTTQVPVKIEDKAAAVATLDVKIPLPQTYGCYVITIAPNGEHPQFLCSVLCDEASRWIAHGCSDDGRRREFPRRWSQ